jgi:hypothetical protein
MASKSEDKRVAVLAAVARDKEWIVALKDFGLVPSCFEATQGCTPFDVVEALNNHITKLVQAKNNQDKTLEPKPDQAEIDAIKNCPCETTVDIYHAIDCPNNRRA